MPTGCPSLFPELVCPDRADLGPVAAAARAGLPATNTSVQHMAVNIVGRRKRRVLPQLNMKRARCSPSAAAVADLVVILEFDHALQLIFHCADLQLGRAELLPARICVRSPELGEDVHKGRSYRGLLIPPRRDRRPRGQAGPQSRHLRDSSPQNLDRRRQAPLGNQITSPSEL